MTTRVARDLSASVRDVHPVIKVASREWKFPDLFVKHARRFMIVIALLPWYASTTMAVDSVLATCCSESCDDGCDGIGCIKLDDRTVWTASGSALFLSRSNPNGSILGFNTANPAEQLNSGDIDFGFQTGYEISLAKRIDDCYSVDLRWFSVDGWNDRTTTSTTFGDLLQFNSSVPLFTTAGTAIDAAFSSELHNAEFNLARKLSSKRTVFGGFRYLELDEQVSIGLLGAPIPTDIDIATRNRLYGGQLGGRFVLRECCRNSLSVFGATGLFGNMAASDATVTSFVSLPSNGQDTRLAFVGELGLDGRMVIARGWSLTYGYRTLWIDGVSLATDQLASSDFFTGTANIDSSTVFYHGATAGLELRF